MKNLTTISIILFASAINAQAHKSLVPGKPSAVPDYFSTWNIQGYVVSYDGPATPRVMTEQYMFGNGALEGWIQFFPDFREDLIFLMDDSWDIPINDHRSELMGEARLDIERFPRYKGNLKKLIKKTKQAGMAYWKVDFGRQERNQAWREQLTQLGRKYAPRMPIEHAYTYPVIEKSDVFRTYDVEVVTAVPVTLQRVTRLLKYKTQLPKGARIWAQDQIGKQPVDITSEVEITGTTLTLSGTLLERIGTQAKHPGDDSAPGLVMTIE